ncbi:hypothetical protein V496_00331 [Pseudogymnoascus sp. VKM F-4515 (FW-2607)]|nr:hypothetical protein V496_00331 [Pseudogymnoascus sp. VKM F-4515 (FW-2607)]
MRKLFKNGGLLRRDKVEAEAATTTKGTLAAAAAAVDPIPLAQKPDLYSTEGSIGMKVVAEPSDAVLDIVFVHGLTGNRETTWTHENGVFWPKQLAQDIDTARIMTYGYDADVIKIWGMAGGNNLRNHGKSLAFGVSDRRRDCRERPIIFIAHSLGGLVCEQALLCCGEGDKNLEKVFRSTRGIIFMGTPHAGSDLANWGYVLATLLSTLRNTNSAILDPLRQKSDVLTAIQQQFQQCLRKPGVNIEIYCFFEEKAVVGVGVIVPEYSATLSQYPNQSIAANHMDMTRFSGMKDEGYQKVLSRIQDTIEVMEPSKMPFDDPKSHPDYEKRKSCHRKFSVPDYQRYKERNQYPVKGTCQWFLRHPNYTGWRDSDGSSILWVSADPGCGKSVLSKLLVDKELQATKSRTTCYFFFKDDSDIQKTATSALCALLHQIFAQKPELLGHAVVVFDQNKEERLMTSVNLLWQILTTAAEDPQAGEIICILDALDECRHSELKLLLQKLCSFYDERSRMPTNTTLKFLVTSRPLQHIENEFSDLSRKIPAIRLAGEEHTDEILYETGLVIEHEIEKIQLDFPMHPKTVRILRDEFTKVENRTYLWLMLIFDLIRQDLQSVMTSTEREMLFHTIPKSVDTAYSAILNKSTNKDRARKLLMIVCAATRPLSTMEITTALLIQENHKTYDDLEIPPDGFSKTYIRNLCGLFVSVIDGRVFLLHQTAKEFLMAKEDCNPPQFHLSHDESWKSSVTIHDSNYVLASMCMWFQRLEEFMSPSIKEGDIGQLVSKYEFFKYSARNWLVHFQAAVVLDGDPLLNVAIEICDVPVDPHVRFQLETERGAFSYDFCSDGYNILHVASILGLEKVLCQLLAAPSIDINAVTKDGITPLWWAADWGHEAIVSQLLAAPGIDVNAERKDGETPLQRAVAQGHKAIVVQLLAVPSIDVNAAYLNRSPLWVAADRGYEEILAQLLAVPGIDVNAADNIVDGGFCVPGASPLGIAAYSGHEETIALLLAAPGIDVNHIDMFGVTPLFHAIRRGGNAVVDKFLATPGINVNATDENGRTPLIYAASRGHKGIIEQLLIAPSIDVDAVNATDEDGRTPLMYAAYRGQDVAVGQLLAVPGINVDAADKNGHTPLFCAAREGHKGAVEQLLTAPSISINATSTNGETPLWGAACNGLRENCEVVGQLLAAPGINVNAANKDGLTPLCCATTRGHGGIVGQLLAAPNINVNASDKDGLTPLWHAIDTGHEGVVRQLLAAPSINVNITNEKNSYTPLLLAAFKGSEAIVGQLLATPNINVNAVDKRGYTPLLIAAMMGHKEVVRQLLAAPSINVNISDDNNRTPLSSAADRGHETTLALLLATPSINVNGAGVNENSQSPIWLAAYSGHVTIIGQLLAAPGINVNTIQHGTTPLQIAAQMGHQDAVRQLLTAPNIDINAAKHNGVTPLSIAQDGGYEGIVKLLQSRAIVVGENPEEGSA